MYCLTNVHYLSKDSVIFLFLIAVTEEYAVLLTTNYLNSVCEKSGKCFISLLFLAYSFQIIKSKPGFTPKKIV